MPAENKVSSGSQDPERQLFGKAAAANVVNGSVIGRLLQEVSWEGGANLRRYRDGGCGRENVLTAEVMQALNFLPRTQFLGAVIAAAHGADRARGVAAAEIEEAEMSILDEVRLNPSATRRWDQMIVQPDALIRSTHSYTLVELKGLRGNSFGERQLAKEYAAAVVEARGRSTLVLLVICKPPPILVTKCGRLPVEDAAALNLDQVVAGSPDHALNVDDLLLRIPQVFAWMTWSELADVVAGAAAGFEGPDTSMIGTVRRLAASISTAIRVHT